MAKYPLVREQLRACGLLDATAELVPEEAAHDDLARVHTAGYLARLFGEGLTLANNALNFLALVHASIFIFMYIG